MKRTPLRVAAVSAMTAAIALGTVTGAEAHSANHGHHGHESKAKAAAKKLAATKAHVARDAAKKVTALSRVETKIVRADLGADNTTAIKANIATDKTALTGLGQRVGYATTLSDAYKAGAAVNAYHPERYESVRYLLGADNRLAVKATGLNAAITALTATTATQKAAGADVTVIEKALADATAATLQGVAAAGASEDKALAVHANTPKRGADSALAQAKGETYKATVALGTAAKQVEVAKTALAALQAPATAARR